MAETYDGPATIVQDGLEVEIECLAFQRQVEQRPDYWLIEWSGRFVAEGWIDANADTRLRLPDGREGIVFLDYVRVNDDPYTVTFIGSGEPPF